MRLRQSLRLLALVAVCCVLSGCSPRSQTAVTLDAKSGRPTLVVGLCRKELVRRVELGRWSGEGDRLSVLWRADSAAGARVSRVVLGVVPRGFREVVPLGEVPTSGSFVFLVGATGGVAPEHWSEFEVEGLRAGVLSDAGARVSAAEFRSDVEANCRWR